MEIHDKEFSVYIPSEDKVDHIDLSSLKDLEYDSQCYLVESTACIYLIYNQVKDKLYVGETSRSLWERFHYGGSAHFQVLEDEDYPDYNNPMYQDMLNQDLKGFLIFVLETDIEDRYIRRAKESEWIKFFDSNNPEVGYNRNDGGLGNAWASCHTPEMRRQIAETRREYWSYNDGSTQVWNFINGIRFTYKDRTICGDKFQALDEDHPFIPRKYVEMDFYIQNWDKYIGNFMNHIDHVMDHWDRLIELDETLKDLFFWVDPSDKDLTFERCELIWNYYTYESCSMSKEFMQKLIVR